MLNPSQISDILLSTAGLMTRQADSSMILIDAPAHGYLVAIQKILPLGDRLEIHSSQITNSEWWEAFIPNVQCPRFLGGELRLLDEMDKYCQVGDCEAGCRAEDGYVELKAGRFRLREDRPLVDRLFPALRRFLSRCEQMVAQVNQESGAELALELSPTLPYLRANIANDEGELKRYLRLFREAYEAILGVSLPLDPNIPITPLAQIDEETTEGLLEMIRNAALQEVYYQACIDGLGQLTQSRNGLIDVGKSYEFDLEKLKYSVDRDRLVAWRDGLYMGNIEFKRGVREVQSFVATTLGGGRW